MLRQLWCFFCRQERSHDHLGSGVFRCLRCGHARLPPED